MDWGCFNLEFHFHLFALQVLLREVDDRKPKLEKLKERSESLIDSAETDQESVTDSINDSNDRYERLTGMIEERLEKLTKAEETLKKYKENMEPVEELFEKIDSVLEDQPSHGIDEQKIQNEIEKLEVIVAVCFKELLSPRVHCGHATIHLFEIRGAKIEALCCFRFCIIEAKVLFCVQSVVIGQIFTFI